MSLQPATTTQGGLLPAIDNALGITDQTNQTIETINKVVPMPKQIYNDAVNQVINPVVKTAVDIKDQSFDYLGFGLTLGFIVLGTGVILYGADIIRPLKEIGIRIGENGVNLNGGLRL